jgi:S1-C subfamily serine protease
MPLNPTISALYKIPVQEGLLVVRIIPGSPAERSGLLEGDIILAVDGKLVKKIGDLRKAIEEGIDRGYVELEVMRGSDIFRVRTRILID